MDRKISQLNNISSSQLTDLIAISRDMGGGDWESRSESYHDLLHSVLGGRIITVGSAGAMATTIGEAVEHAGADFSPSASNPVVIQVSPGVYVEDPIVIPDYVAIVGVGGSKGVYVTPSDPDNIMFTMGFNSELVGFRIQGASGSGCGVKSVSATMDCIVRDVTVRNCSIGFHATGSGAVIRSYHCSILATVACDDGILVEDGAVCSFYTPIIRTAGPGTITNGVRVTGTSSTLNMSTYRIASCTNGIYVNDSAHANTDSGFIDGCTNAMRIGGDGSNSSLEAYATSIIDSVTYDVLIESSTGDIDFTGKMNYWKRSVVSGAKFDSIGVDGDNEILKLTGATSIEEKADIGVPGASALGLDTGLDVGEGGSYLYDKDGNEIVEYWSYDASAASGSRFTRFSGNAGTQLADNGDSLVIGSQFPFSASRMDVNVAAVLGGSSFIAEHWNGLTWVTDTICGYKKSDMTHRGNTIFQNVESQYVEFGTAINDDWASDNNVLDTIPSWDNTLNMYTIRFRNNGALTSGMEFDGGKVRGDDFDISESFKIINWGRYRQEATTVFTPAEMTPDSNNPTASEKTDFSPNVSGTFTAKYTDANVSSMNFRQVIPEWADTSSGVTMLIRMYPSDSSAGNVNMNVRYVPLQNPLTLDGTNTEYTTSLIGVTSETQNEVFEITNTFDISAFDPTNKFIVAIERDATAGNPLDTYSGDVTILGVLLTWTRKAIG